jgi:hydrogenase maturation protein HypF
LIAQGCVIAIKGLGGYQLACDATQPAAVQRLRRLKRREAKPFALLGADLEMIERFCEVGASEREALLSAAAPIVLLRRREHAPDPSIAEDVAPRIDSLGFMLPGTGMLHLVMQRMKHPIVLTSGNLSGEPQAITPAELDQRFASGIDFVLDHDRPIARRIDDSVVRVVDCRQRVQRRARGLAPQPLTMPAGFEAAPAILAYGADLKNSFCLLRNGQAVLSQHIGDLTEATVLADYRRALADLTGFFGFEAHHNACDAHPSYLSSQIARERRAVGAGRPVEVLHHHAHLAACLVDNGWPLAAGPVIGVALDGIGFGLAADGHGKTGAKRGAANSRSSTTDPSNAAPVSSRSRCSVATRRHASRGAIPIRS